MKGRPLPEGGRQPLLRLDEMGFEPYAQALGTHAMLRRTDSFIGEQERVRRLAEIAGEEDALQEKARMTSLGTHGMDALVRAATVIRVLYDEVTGDGVPVVANPGGDDDDVEVEFDD